MDDFNKTLEGLNYDEDTINALKKVLSSDCKKTETDKELKKDCNCANSSLGEKDECLENWENRFSVQANNGDFRGINFNGENLVPCTELDIIFNCAMISERIKDTVIVSGLNFVRNQINNSSSTLSQLGNMLSGAIVIG